MTPAARVAAAVEILDRYLAGQSAEKALTNWGRRNRFAGSKDRSAIRDLVFDAIRCRASFARLGGAMTGRGLMIGALRSNGSDPELVFDGKGYGPAAMTAHELKYEPPAENTWPRHERLDYPDWLDEDLSRCLEDDLEPLMQIMKRRAPVFLRVNTARTDLEKIQADLAADGVQTAPCALSETALLVTEGARAVRNSSSYRMGLVELQDAASQALVDALGGPSGDGRVLDYCAGGGGKSLGLASRGWSVTAHDAIAQRMKDLPARAARAGVRIETLDNPSIHESRDFDLVLVDVPCSGIGAWRRQPEARWSLTRRRLTELTELQAEILNEAASHVRSGGRLAYATCSLLDLENEKQTAEFLRTSGSWKLISESRWSPLDGGDGFYLALIENREI